MAYLGIGPLLINTTDCVQLDGLGSPDSESQSERLPRGTWHPTRTMHTFLKKCDWPCVEYDNRHVALATVRVHYLQALFGKSRVSDRPAMFGSSTYGSVAPRMGVAKPLRRPTASGGRKRPWAVARLVRFTRAARRRSRLRVAVFPCARLFSLWLFGYLFVGNPDLWDRGLVTVLGSFFCGLFTPSNPSPGHRLVPESQVISRRTSYVLVAFDYTLYDVYPTISYECRG